MGISLFIPRIEDISARPLMLFGGLGKRSDEGELSRREFRGSPPFRVPQKRMKMGSEISFHFSFRARLIFLLKRKKSKFFASRFHAPLGMSAFVFGS